MVLIQRRPFLWGLSFLWRVYSVSSLENAQGDDAPASEIAPRRQRRRRRLFLFSAVKSRGAPRRRPEWTCRECHGMGVSRRSSGCSGANVFPTLLGVWPGFARAAGPHRADGGASGAWRTLSAAWCFAAPLVVTATASRAFSRAND
jgi:hypothetical protein